MQDNVDYLFKFTLRVMKKNMAGGLGNEDFERFWNGESRSYQDDLLGRWQARNNGKTGLNTGLIEDETIMQKLSPFIVPETLTITSGQSEKPDDFVFRLALRINGEDCYKINHNQIATVNNSVIDPPSIADNKYYFVEYGKTFDLPNGYYSFIPTTVTDCDLDYIATPRNIKWGFTWDSQDRQIYNSGLSTQSQWDNNSNMEITKRMFKTLGVSFKDADFANFGQSVITTGN
jgi:hypothetical protein